MENLILEEENIIKDIRKTKKKKKELNYTAIIDTRSIFRLEKETKAIKDRILRNIKNVLSMKAKKITNQYK